LAIYYEGQGELLPVWLAWVALAGSVLVSLVRAQAETMSMSLREGLFTRVERVVLTAVALILGHWLSGAVTVALWVLAVLSSLTAVQRLYYVGKLSRTRRDDEAGG
jgi:CDP-diacylglycerol--glycerol-3-phosphate 3-phosphatidyltransferase